MSIMTTQLEARRISVEPALSLPTYSTGNAVTTLADMRKGQTAHIVDVCDELDPASARRMFDLGFAPGAEVEMLRKAPMADPVVFRIAGYDIALRRVQARCIHVAITT
ncbi:FeoA family protein [Rhodococcus sp. AW25M09]|uniref:FeoA family protein n=1 Tax=Rhodococcus sp. AW25M09 TaxID=1268303 RepID=UPI0002ABBB08|nr:FeoA family protein [Rhodococcus sp. AW25M09]CCQ16422.1 FeoA family protein [Rhodococcus sp. AW25M09]